MIERFATRAGRADEDLELRFHLRLADVFVHTARADRALNGFLFAVHRTAHCSFLVQWTATSLARGALESPADQLLGGVCTGTDSLEQACRFRGTVSQRHQCAERLALGTGRGRHDDGTLSTLNGPKAVPHLDQKPFRRLAADTRHASQCGGILILDA